MSKKTPEEKRVITVGELITRANQLRDYIASLSSYLETLALQINELETARSALNAMPSQDFASLLSIDKLNAILIQALIPRDWHTQVLVNIGRNYYLKTSREKAIDIINKRLSNLRRIANEVQRQYQLALNEYNAIQQILASIYARLEQQRQKTESGQKTT
ncbi:MAG: prefoldin domain-containing protein [Thermoprotei archaeon]